jgi:hypothetical protein
MVSESSQLTFIEEYAHMFWLAYKLCLKDREEDLNYAGRMTFWKI